MTNDSANRAPEIISRGRVEALSDGVFAIVVMLLVLEITVPHVTEHDSTAELARALWTPAPPSASQPDSLSRRVEADPALWSQDDLVDEPSVFTDTLVNHGSVDPSLTIDSWRLQ